MSDDTSQGNAARPPSPPSSPPYTEADFLDDALAGAMSLTPAKLLALDEEVLLRHSLLAASLLGHLGGLAAAEAPIAHSHFLELLRVFAGRCNSSRPLKLRFALLLRVAHLDALRETWRPVPIHDPECYERLEAALAGGAVEVAGGAAGEAKCRPGECAHFASPEFVRVDPSEVATEDRARLSIATVTPDELLESDRRLAEYAVSRFFHPRSGIVCRTKRRGLKTYPDAFSEYDVLLYLMQDLMIREKGVASALGMRMAELGIIRKVSRRPSLGPLLLRGGGEAFGFGHTVYRRAKEPSLPNVSFRSLSVEDGDEAGGDAISRQRTGIDVRYGMDTIDMQSLYFWSSILFDKPLVEGSSFGFHTVVHPFATEREGDNESGDSLTRDHGGMIAHSVHVKKVFKSMARPGILSLSSYPPGCALYPPEKAASECVEVEPRIISKTGDNLLQDLSVTVAFRVFNHVWRSDERFGGANKAPFSCAYDVLPTGNRRGLLEFMPGIKPLNDYDWATWVKENGNNKEVLNTMLQSAAGCSIATYILGCGDRHWDNIQIQHGTTLLHIDFGMILGENPPFKTPRFSISAGMEQAFKDVGIWDGFVEMCGEAFLSLRSRSGELMHLVAMVIEHADKSRPRILRYLASQPSLNIAEEDDAAAVEFVLHQVRTSSRNWETIMRKFTHDRVDPIFFKAVAMARKSLDLDL